MEGTVECRVDEGDQLLPQQSSRAVAAGRLDPHPCLEALNQVLGRRNADIRRQQRVFDLLPRLVVEPISGQQREQPPTEGRLRSAEAGAEPLEPPGDRVRSLDQRHRRGVGTGDDLVRHHDVAAYAGCGVHTALTVLGWPRLGLRRREAPGPRREQPEGQHQPNQEQREDDVDKLHHDEPSSQMDCQPRLSRPATTADATTRRLGQAGSGSRSRWLMTEETPSPRMATPYRALAHSMVRFW